MLQHLYIENYILIKNLEVDFHDGFSVITGETGAGKSILVGALGLILGQRADSQVLMDKGKKCILEGSFIIEGYGLEPVFKELDLDYETISTFRREISPQGKSRAFINDTPVNLFVLKDLGERLVDIHSQNQTLELNQASFQLLMVDSYAKNYALVVKYSLAYSTLQKIDKELNDLQEKEAKTNADRDFIDFQLSELVKANLIEGEQDEAEKELEVLLHAEEINQLVNKSLLMLSQADSNIINQLVEIRQFIQQASRHATTLESLSERMEISRIELQDISSELDHFISNIHFDPDRISKLQERLNLVYHLEHKHRAKSVEELTVIRDQLGIKLSEIESLSDSIIKLVNEKVYAVEQLEFICHELTLSRKATFPGIEKEMTSILSKLGMPSAAFLIKIEPIQTFSKNGKDKITFLFSANKGGELREIQRAASGGELSRLMLALKSLILNRSILPTVVFDEIDNGVSGEIAGKVGNILHKMSSTIQVIAITHLPQIAGKADRHMLAYKEDGKADTVSSMRELIGEERVNEIARMLSDENITENSRAAALELMRTNLS